MSSFKEKGCIVIWISVILIFILLILTISFVEISKSKGQVKLGYKIDLIEKFIESKTNYKKEKMYEFRKKY